MEEAQIREKLGEILTTLSNYNFYLDDTSRMNDQLRLGSLKVGMRDTRHQVLQLYQELGGVDKWHWNN